MSDDSRMWDLVQEYGDLKAEVSSMKAELIPLKEGVSNFRQFQKRGNQYFDRAEAVLDAQEVWRRKRMGWIKVLAPFAVALVGFLCYHWYVFTQDMIQIDEEWRQAHNPAPHQSGYMLRFHTPSLPQDSQLPANALQK